LAIVPFIPKVNQPRSSTGLENSVSFEPLFQAGVGLIGQGDLAALRRLLDEHPELARERLTTKSPWLREKIGDALDGFFQDPYLLWFVAEDVPVFGQLPSNIADLTRVILHSAQGASSFQEQLDSTLRLVCFSTVAHRCGAQIELIDVLVDAGANLEGCPENALVNGHVVAAAHLVARGVPLTLASAISLGHWDKARDLAEQAGDSAKQFALVLAALNGNEQAVKWMIAQGVDVNRPSPDLYAHGTPLHHAVCSGSLATVRALVEAGADLNKQDTAWQGTPLGWATHYLAERKDTPSQQRYTAIADYLRTRCSPS
jgi:peptide-methionine (S)-S-oxide reductase